LEQNYFLNKEINSLQSKLANKQGSDLVNKVVEIKGIKVLSALLENIDVKQLRTTLDQLKDKLRTAVIVLATVKGSKISLVAGVTTDSTHQIKAGDLVKHVAQQVGGKGGGRPDMAQGGGNDPSQLKEALQSVEGWVESRL
jgi:alanyl-tRNA synthetase